MYQPPSWLSSMLPTLAEITARTPRWRSRRPLKWRRLSGPEGVDAKSGFQLGVAEVTQFFLGHEIRRVQHTGGVDDEVKFARGLQLFGSRADAGLIVKVQARLGLAVHPTTCTHRGHARRWAQVFARWYNTEHHHSGLKFVTPDQRHRGEDVDLLARRYALYQTTQAERLMLECGDARLAARQEGSAQPRKTPQCGAPNPSNYGTINAQG